MIIFLNRKFHTKQLCDFFIYPIQFLRNEYFCLDFSKNEKGNLIFNKSVSLKSSYKVSR